MSEYSFSGIISKCKSFGDFYFHLTHLAPKLSGDLFELFSEYYFLFAYEQPVKNYYPVGKIPYHILRRFDLPTTDIGADALIEFQSGEWVTVQAKFRSNIHKATDYKELSTWLATTFKLAPKGVLRGILITNAEVITDKLKYSTNIIRVTGRRFRELDTDFFKLILEAEDQKKQSNLNFPPPKQITLDEKEINRKQLFEHLNSLACKSKFPNI